MILLAWMLLPLSIPTQTVDLIELNHYRSADGCHGFDQLIFWEWSPDYRRYHAMGWVILSEAGNRPARDAQGYAVRVLRNGREYIVRSPLYRETTTQHDPERANLRLLPEDQGVERSHPRRQSGKAQPHIFASVQRVAHHPGKKSRPE